MPLGALTWAAKKSLSTVVNFPDYKTTGCVICNAKILGLCAVPWHDCEKRSLQAEYSLHTTHRLGTYSTVSH